MMDADPDNAKTAHAPRVPPWVAPAKEAASAAEAGLWQALEEVEDPEYPVSIVDMGLIYKIALRDDVAHVDLSFTSMGCPCMEFIIDDLRARLLQEPDVSEVALRIVWDPPWTRQRLTEKGAEKLRQWGIAV
ncbi:MAG: metal-sulfur cluster assembly factor [Candidatus Promineifilaceae bacterium]|nr:metal-sulfur cluster assembly factor [Candidatus Promineifilaceae bacterium]